MNFHPESTNILFKMQVVHTYLHALSGPTLILKCYEPYGKVNLVFKILRKQTPMLKTKKLQTKYPRPKPPLSQQIWLLCFQMMMKDFHHFQSHSYSTTRQQRLYRIRIVTNGIFLLQIQTRLGLVHCVLAKFIFLWRQNL